jgi:uncharacterized secreted protein with C-terminal beta-propeller domain
MQLLSRLGLFGFVFVTACGTAAATSSSSGPPPAPTSPTPGLVGAVLEPHAALVSLATCDDVAGYIRQRLIAEMNRQIDQQVTYVDQGNDYCPSYGGWGGGMEGSSSSSGAMPAGASANAPAANGAGAASSSGGSSGSSGASGSSDSHASSVSTTNNQTAGVDEADFVKNDDKYLYIAADNAFQIVQAWPASDVKEVSRIAIEGTPKELFVDGDRAVVFVSIPPPPPPGTGGPPGTVGSSSYGSSGGSSGSSSGSSGSYASSGGYTSPGGYSSSSNSSQCSYGYGCVPSGDGTATRVLVFDIADRTAPKVTRRIDLSGSLLAARRIGSAVHTVVVEPEMRMPELEGALTPDTSSCKSTDDAPTRRLALHGAWEALRQRNIIRINAMDVLGLLPSIKDSGMPAPACTSYYRPELPDSASFTTVMSFDLTTAELPHSATVVSDPGVVYASETGLYMAVPHSRSASEGWYDSCATVDEVSTIHKFRIGEAPSLTAYQGSGVVKGHVLNQFSLDEWQQNLRVATTTGEDPDPDAHSTVSVLGEQGGGLIVTGAVDNIAVGEDIRSVRFDGSRGFVVTFKKTDPLYVFDLGNPSAPTLSGELQIPGFSTYMHMMDAEHLLTIGYDALDEGNFAWFQGVLLQIFDVSDMRNPTLAHKELIGTRGSSSEALSNHLAFNYFAEKNLLAIPMTICEGGYAGSYGTEMTFSGLMVYDVTAANGFSLRGKVAHPNTTDGNGYDAASCMNWWANASSEVKRSVFMDDVVYSISDRRVKANNLANLSVDLAEVGLTRQNVLLPPTTGDVSVLRPGASFAGWGKVLPGL